MKDGNIAVIAIHGVGDHEAFDSGRAVSSLLANVRDSAHLPVYSDFRENLVRLNVRKTATLGRTERLAQKVTWGPMDAIANEIALTPRGLPQAGVRSLSHLFLDGQLARAKDESSDAPYPLLRLDAVRQQGESKCNVSVFDMHWSDLSGVGTAFTRIFYELYQLLFHLTSVGSHNIQAAITHLGRGGITPFGWKAFEWLYFKASQTLVWPIALFNLFMLALVIPITGASLMYTQTTGEQAVAIVVGLATAILCVSVTLLLLKRPPVHLGPLSGTLVAILGIAGALYALARNVSIEISTIALAVILILVSAGLVVYVVQQYARRRPGSGRAALGCFGIWLLFGLMLLVSGRFSLPYDVRYSAILACLSAFEILFVLATVSWGVFAALYLLTLASSFIALKQTPKEHLDRAGRTRWTAILTLTLPSMAFLLITLAFWAAVLKVVVPVLPGDRVVPPAPHVLHVNGCPVPPKNEPRVRVLPNVCYTSVFTKETKPVQGWAIERMRDSGVGYFPILFGAIVIAVIMTAWVFGPVVWREVKPPRASDGSAQWFERLALALGTWLSGGFRFLHWAGYVLVAGMLVFFLIAAAILYVHRGSMKIDESSTAMTEALGAIVVGAGVGLVGFRGRLSNVALGFRPIVRVMLDVDNWLREHPRESNPTARICARYTTVLRYIANYRDPVDESPFDAVVIVAHSQGTVITADLLRFLFAEARDAEENGREYDPELSPLFNGSLPVYLFTMGCPLNQLYALRFPYLYGWASADAKAADFTTPDILPNGEGELPGADPETLGVRQWVNGYRSGDYIGRCLWRPESCNYAWTPVVGAARDGWDPPAKVPEFVSVDRSGRRIEYCIGPGAHTHYWDSTAEPIAEGLDRIIVGALLRGGGKR